MKEGPDIALLGSLIGDPARANMLVALMSGKALTASELSAVAGITVQTASSHLKKMRNGGLLCLRKQGRHHYFALADDDVGLVLEAMMGLAASKGHMRTRTGPADPALRYLRICYDHMAGDMGVLMFDSMRARSFIVERGEELHLSDRGDAFISQFGIETAGLKKQRRLLCRPCLDWSARRTHLAGALGAAVLTRFTELGWIKRQQGSRIIAFAGEGERQFLQHFPSHGF